MTKKAVEQIFEPIFHIFQCFYSSPLGARSLWFRLEQQKHTQKDLELINVGFSRDGVKRTQCTKFVGGEGVRNFLLEMGGKSHFYPSLYSTKTSYHWYISDPFWQCTENVDSFICISLEYTENYIDNFFEYQGKMFLNIERFWYR